MVRIGVMCILFAISLLLQGCSEEKKQGESPPPAPPPLPVEIVTVAKEQIPIWIEYTGKTEATQRVEVRARVAGRLNQVLFEEGGYVEQGELLFVIEKDAYQAALAQAQAQLQKNRATLELARKDVERYAPLVAEDLAPRATLEQYQARVAELEAAIQPDTAAVKNAELDLSYTEITAPISGRISRKLVDAGNIVGYGEQTMLTTIVSDDPIYAYFNPTESQFQTMKQFKSQERMDALVSIRDDMQGLLKREPLRGKVNFSDNRIDRNTGTISMRAEVANPNHSILEGSFVYVEVMVTDQPAFIMVQPGAILEDQRSSFVYVADSEGKAQRVDIVRGYENRHYAIINQGLEGGERVIISGLTKVSPGKAVSPTDVTATKGVRARLDELNMLEKTE